MIKKRLSAEDMKLSNSQLKSKYGLSKAQTKAVRYYAIQHPEATEYPVPEETNQTLHGSVSNASTTKGCPPVFPPPQVQPGVVISTDECGRTSSTVYSSDPSLIKAYSTMGLFSQFIRLIESIVNLFTLYEGRRDDNDDQ